MHPCTSLTKASVGTEVLSDQLWCQLIMGGCGLIPVQHRAVTIYCHLKTLWSIRCVFRGFKRPQFFCSAAQDLYGPHRETFISLRRCSLERDNLCARCQFVKYGDLFASVDLKWRASSSAVNPYHGHAYLPNEDMKQKSMKVSRTSQQLQ